MTTYLLFIFIYICIKINLSCILNLLNRKFFLLFFVHDTRSGYCLLYFLYYFHRVDAI